MAFQGEEFLARVRIPYFTGPIVTPGDEFITGFVEGTICQRLTKAKEETNKSEMVRKGETWKRGTIKHTRKYTHT